MAALVFWIRVFASFASLDAGAISIRAVLDVVGVLGGVDGAAGVVVVLVAFAATGVGVVVVLAVLLAAGVAMVDVFGVTVDSAGLVDSNVVDFWGVALPLMGRSGHLFSPKLYSSPVLLYLRLERWTGMYSFSSERAEYGA